jgi:hypothetical protein
LPTELRLKIWRNIFPPPRRVQLGIVDPKKPIIPESPQPPITLFINQESRSETRKYYEIIHYDYEKGRGSGGDEERIKWITFICVERDTLVINSRLAFFRRDLLRSATSQLADKLKGGLESICAVEFSKWNWVQVFHRSIPGLAELNTNIWWAIGRFPGMRTLDFVLHDSVQTIDAQACQKALVTFFQENKASYNRGVLPKVTFVEPFDHPIWLET